MEKKMEKKMENLIKEKWGIDRELEKLQSKLVEKGLLTEYTWCRNCDTIVSLDGWDIFIQPNKLKHNSCTVICQHCKYILNGSGYSE